jgi:hypothetical protein
MSTADLRASAQRLRQQARLAEEAARLARLSSELGGCACCRGHADASEKLAATCDMAAQALMDMIEVYELTHRQATGRAPPPSRPTLRVIDK